MSFLKEMVFKKINLPAKQKKRETDSPEAVKKETSRKDKWFVSEGKLAIDLLKKEGNLVLRSTIAGVRAEDLDITMQGDTITIKGKREKPADDKNSIYYIEECFWGPFSRQIILPEEVDPLRIEATLREGILTITAPCLEKERERKVSIKD